MLGLAESMHTQVTETCGNMVPSSPALLWMFEEPHLAHPLDPTWRLHAPHANQSIITSYQCFWDPGKKAQEQKLCVTHLLQR